jgi:hypothetical protein
MTAQRNRAFAFDVQKELTLEYDEAFVFAIVLAPVVLALENPQTYDAPRRPRRRKAG